MKRTMRGILVMNCFIAALTAHRAMAQQGQISIDKDGVQQNYVIQPDGTYQVGKDGSMTPVDPNSVPALQGIVLPNGQNGGANNGGRPRIAPPIGNGGAGKGQIMQQLQEQARQHTLESIRTALGCSDPEWAALQPRIQKIQDLQYAVMPGTAIRAPRSVADSPSSVLLLADSVQQFEKLVSASDASDTQVTQAMASVREARGKVKADLAQARKELTDLLTPRQEVILFQWGILAE